MRRIVVLGSSGSGKTTLARELAALLSVPHIELDALHWEPNWTATPLERFRRKVSIALDDAGDGWTVCGHYGQVRDLLWPRADTVVWLDYPLTIAFGRVARRTARRWWTSETLWNGNRERLWTQLCTRDSLLLWVLTTWRQRRRDYPVLFRSPPFAHLRVVRLRHPRQTEAWLQRCRDGRRDGVDRCRG